MLHRTGTAPLRIVQAAYLVTALAGAGCAVPEDPYSDFATYTGSAVAEPYDADAGPGGTGGAAGTGGSGVASGTGATGTGGSTGATGTSGSTGATGATGTGGTGAAGGTAGSADTGGAGTTGSTGDTAGAGGGPTAGLLSFDVLTASLGGKYAPRNIGAIWIEDASGNWVKTLEAWARTREQYLTRFVGKGKNRVDAISSATLSSHRVHQVAWDSTDVNGNVVPDGEYQVVIETTDHNGTGDSTTVPFTKGPTPVQITPGDATHFRGMSLSYQ